ncbi:MAG TPA: Hpt domain-containing protein [Candidatus Binataceae bacterium]|nr:Hpt domain-containing protein [Candidatus Binataceae bacterium]
MDTDSHDAANGAPVDREVIQNLRDEGENLLSELVEMFIVEVPGQLATLEAALAKDDAGATRLTAHTLKGTGGNFGAARMLALATALEEKGRDGSLEGASALLVALRAECLRVRKALEAEQLVSHPGLPD